MSQSDIDALKTIWKEHPESFTYYVNAELRPSFEVGDRQLHNLLHNINVVYARILKEEGWTPYPPKEISFAMTVKEGDYYKCVSPFCQGMFCGHLYDDYKARELWGKHYDRELGRRKEYLYWRGNIDA